MKKMKFNSKPVLNIGINKVGTDYIVGDIHGCFDKLIDKIDSVGFDKSKDRLFAVGDIIDRGPDSIKCVDLLNESWFYSVRGNHCQAAIDYSRGQMTTHEYIQWGGGWFCDLPSKEQSYIAETLDKLPWVIQLKTKHGVIGIVHSQPIKIDGRYNWQQFIKAVKNDEMITNWNSIRDACTWYRRIVEDETELKGNILGILAVAGGHSTIPSPLKHHNFYCIDTGAVYNTEEEGYGYFTLLRADTLEFI